MKVYQIYYSDETRKSNDSGFLQLDNLGNDRPDWREYWPIRKYLLENTLDENTFYGFLSPKFKDKTGLSSDQVYEFLEKNKDANVCTFSPFFDQSAIFINVFEQSNAVHPGTINFYKELFGILDLGIDISTMCMHSLNTVYCNYFVAKPAFWRVWFAHCELIFNIAETEKNKLSVDLNATVPHDYSQAPLKVFVIERIVSLLLSLNDWGVKPYSVNINSFALKNLIDRRGELYILDSLKIAYHLSGEVDYLKLFLDRRKSFFSYD